MKYATLGDTGLIVSRLALGTMTFGTGFAPVQKVEQATARELVARALDRGVNFFDTANQYAGGQAEELLGRALGARRHDVVVSTKVGLRLNDDNVLDAGLSYRHVLASAEASLRRLGTDYIDLLQLHLPDPLTPLEETARALDDLVRRGWVRYIGFCSFPAWQAALFLGLQRERGYPRFVSAQLHYSLLNRDIEHELVPLAREAGLAVLPWSPLSGGFLSGKYGREQTGGEADRRATFHFPPVDLNLGYRVVDRLREIARPLGASVAQVALAWLLTRPFVTSVLIGATRLDQLDDNLAAVNLALPGEAVQVLDEMTAPPALYPNWMRSYFDDRVTREALGG
jgi:aryl-alcohol dehydrogenase-like predicted oxidoreductase